MTARQIVLRTAAKMLADVGLHAEAEALSHLRVPIVDGGVTIRIGYSDGGIRLGSVDWQGMNRNIASSDSDAKRSLWIRVPHEIAGVAFAESDEVVNAGQRADEDAWMRGRATGLKQ